MATAEPAGDVAAVERARDRYLLKLKQINDILHPEDGVYFEARSLIRADVMRCSFCNLDQSQVMHLIAGPSVFICNECVTACVEIIASTKASVEPATTADAVDPHATSTGNPSTPDTSSSKD